MIKDKIKNAHFYFNLHPKFKEAFEKIINNDLQEKRSELYFNFDKYQTKDNGDFEAHRKYIDIQYILKGEEKIGITNIDECKTIIKYDSEKDIEFLETEKFDFITLKEGEFAIFFPHDAHKPCLTDKEKSNVKKIVAKVLM